MNKHTPGPWAVEPRQWDHGASLAIVAPNSGYSVDQALAQAEGK